MIMIFEEYFNVNNWTVDKVTNKIDLFKDAE